MRYAIMRHFLLVILSILSMGTMSFGKMTLLYQWKYLDLLWESPQQKQEAIDSGAYNASAAFLYDVDKAPDGRVFITVTKDNGVPATLLTVTEKQGDGGPLLRPYPDWSWYKNHCKGIGGGVQQVDIKCNHLFVVDDGKIGIEQICSPQLLIFDLSTDKLVNRVTIPPEIAANKTHFGMLVSCYVYAPDCRNVKNMTIVFMGDMLGSGLIIYETRTSKLRRVETDFMKATNTNFVLENQSYSTLLFGIAGLTVIDKDLYYAAFGGNKIYKIKHSKLMECPINLNDINDSVNQDTKLMVALEGQTTMITSDRCAIFFNDITNTSVMCADATKEINSKNKEVIASDSKQLQFLSGMKVRDGDLMVLSNRLFLHLSNSLNVNEINFRVLSIPIKEIEKNTNCFSSCKH